MTVRPYGERGSVRESSLSEGDELTAQGSGVPKFIVEYLDEAHHFWNSTRMQFGRDDGTCQIPIWQEVNRRTLSKIAGELWCIEDQMWVRNLSAVHELVVASERGTHVLPSRLRTYPGHACSVPPRGSVSAPSTGTWALKISPVEGTHCHLRPYHCTIARSMRRKPFTGAVTAAAPACIRCGDQLLQCSHMLL